MIVTLARILIETSQLVSVDFICSIVISVPGFLSKPSIHWDVFANVLISVILSPAAIIFEYVNVIHEVISRGGICLIRQKRESVCRGTSLGFVSTSYSHLCFFFVLFFKAGGKLF